MLPGKAGFQVKRCSPCALLLGSGRPLVYNGDMGFTTAATILTTAATVAGKAIEASAERRQTREYKAAAEERQRLAGNQAGVITRTALENHRREQRNAQAELATARADAGASGLSGSGTAAVRESDLATRLEDDINNRTNAALQEANTVRSQGAYDARDLRMHASQARLRGSGAWLGAAGGLFRGLSSVDWSSAGSGSSGSNATQV